MKSFDEFASRHPIVANSVYIFYYYILPIIFVILWILWPILYFRKYRDNSPLFPNGFKRTEPKTECSQGIYTTYKNCSGLQKTGRALWDIYTTVYFLSFFLFFYMFFKQKTRRAGRG